MGCKHPKIVSLTSLGWGVVGGDYIAFSLCETHVEPSVLYSPWGFDIVCLHIRVATKLKGVCHVRCPGYRDQVILTKELR